MQKHWYRHQLSTIKNKNFNIGISPKRLYQYSTHLLTPWLSVYKHIVLGYQLKIKHISVVLPTA